ncbi:MAG: Rieske 2Fe-2S domain-containing protein [Bryobacteraceae bacterium]|nr:Rieske 2Fe-2S domain-containing protein [Bryobacteraceae bacterium]
MTRVGSLARLRRFGLDEYVYGDDRIALCLVDGRPHAVDGTCPHSGGPLAQGALHGRTLVCPWHAWEFDCVTGEVHGFPDRFLKTYEVAVEGDDLVIDLA